MPTNETYKLFRRKNGNNDPYKMQVDSAIEDKNGVRIDTNYAGIIEITSVSDPNERTTYTVQLKTPAGENVGTAATFNIAVDSTIVSGSYDTTTGELVLTLSTGDTVRIPVSGFVSGLASQDDVDNLELSIARLYSTAGTYAVGDLVMHNKRLYRCKSAIITGETWTPAHWDAANIDEELIDVRGDINDLQVKTNPFVQMIYNDMYPVGSIYQSTTRNENTKNTADKYGCPLADVITGSKWARISGVFLYGAEDNVTGYTAGSTGGAKTVTLIEANLPSHTHDFSGSYTTGGSGDLSMSGTADISHTHTFSDTTDSDGAHTHSFSGLSTTSTDGYHYHDGIQISYSYSVTKDLATQFSSGPSIGSSILLDTAVLTNNDSSITGRKVVTTSNGNHTHTVTISGTTGSDGSHTHTFSGTTDSGGASDLAIFVSGADHTHDFSISGTTTAAGSDTAFSIMPPFKAIYMWERTE